MAEKFAIFDAYLEALYRKYAIFTIFFFNLLLKILVKERMFKPNSIKIKRRRLLLGTNLLILGLIDLLIRIKVASMDVFTALLDRLMPTLICLLE